MKTIRQACVPRATTFDPARRDTVLDLSDLVEDRIDPAAFFAENHVTEGMRTLLTEGFRRLEGRSTQGVFKLTQAMGGGKTHNLLALGLLAKHPELRAGVMGGFYTPDDIGPVRVVAFSGRESDAPFGVWGAIAEQLGRREQFSDYYSPLSAPGQTAWVNLLRGDPLVIMLDELPPYFVNAASKSIGNSDLSVVTATALANLLVAVGRDELSNVCLVMSDLTASYAAGSERIAGALRELEKETGRAAMNLEPVRMNTDEFYRILRTRLFESLPNDADVEAVAQGYAKAVREAKQMDVTNASPEQFASRVVESYPFHPAIRDLYARFRANQGFQQTRGLIRLMRIVVSRIWNSDRDPYLIAAHDLDLADRETLTEINQVNPTLENAVAHDVAAGGNAVAEVIDTNLGGGTDAQDTMRLLLVASLANVPGAVKGLALPEIIANLCAPGRDVSRLQNEVVARLVTAAWYLHTTSDGRLHVRNVQNLVARVTTTAGAYLRDQAASELKGRLREIFEPTDGWCYQQVAALPAVDDVDVGAGKVTLVVSEPHPDGLHPDRWREEGQYVNKGPFPKPATTVRIQELSRDDDTGNVKLRVSPVHGDRLYSDAGAPATPASKDLGGGGIFQTNAMLRVSFLAVDSTGGHEPGEPVEWTNRITLESREYVEGGERRMEIRAAPPAPIRYTTDGSDPKLGGGAYDGPFPVPDGVRLVLAVAEKDGIASEIHEREVTDKPRDEPIDATAGCLAPAGRILVPDHERRLPVHQSAEAVRRRRRPPASGRPGRLPVGGTQLLRRHRTGGRRHRTAGRTGAGTPAGRRGRSALRAVRYRPAVPRLDCRQQGIVRARRGGAVTMAAQAALRPGSTGFGFRPDESEHHFVVTVPAGNREDVTVAEHLRFDPEVGHVPPSTSIGPDDAKLRAVLPRAKWNAIADEVRVEFNRRLRKEGLPAGRWKTGANPLARLLGKELTLLAWAVEDADPTLVPAAIRNWLGLAPEERWWLFTMTAAATGHALHGRGRGWRKAVRYALTENPVGAAAVPREIPADTFRLIAPEAHRTRTPGRRRAAAAARRSPAGAGKGGR